MEFTRDQIDYVAHLALIELSDEEREAFGSQLARVLAYMDKLDELDTSGVQPMRHAIDQRDVWRQDVVGESLPREEALQNAPESAEGCFKVPRIIE